MRQLPPDIVSKMSQSLQTTGNDADPKMQVLVSRAKNTVQDSTYWTVETIREINGLGDVSVAPRRFNYKGSPNRIYEIHIRDGIVYTSIREYPDTLRSGFVPQFSLGPGKSVGVAFNGEWKKYRKMYRLVTEDKPLITWVTNDGVLWVQNWDDPSTRSQLSTGVSKVKMLRAWKNLVIHDQDQGVVVAYIKDNGKVYYRNYCIQSDYTEAWEYEKELTGFTGIAVNVNLFITNDYRMGFIIEDNTGKIHWLVTYRNWGGMASPAENLITGVRDITLKVTPIKYYECEHEEHIPAGLSDIILNVAEPIYPEILDANNGDEAENKIWVRFSHPPVELVENSVAAFTIKDNINSSFSIFSIERSLGDPSIIILNTSMFTSMNTKLTITYDRNKYPLNAENQGSLFEINSKQITFIPELTPPEAFTSENISMGILPGLTVSQVYYHDRHTTENLKTNIQNISVIVTKVGDKPL